MTPLETVEEIQNQDDFGKKHRDEINKALDEYEKQINLPVYQAIEAPEYLNMKIAELRKKTPQELTEACYLLGQYSLFLTRTINRLLVWRRWGTGKLDELTALNFDKIGNNGWQERMIVARHSSEPCRQINNFLLQVNSRLDRLQDIPNLIRHVSDTIRDIKFVALRVEKGD